MSEATREDVLCNWLKQLIEWVPSEVHKMLETNWRAEAKVWVATEAMDIITQAHKGNTSNPDLTVGQIESKLTMRHDAPPGFIKMYHEPALRYQFIRAVLESLVTDGRLEHGETLNSRGRVSRSYSPAGWIPFRKSPRARRSSYEVLIDGEADPSVSKRISEWFEKSNLQIQSVYVQKVDEERTEKNVGGQEHEAV